jgi:hypothetical protein
LLNDDDIMTMKKDSSSAKRAVSIVEKEYVIESADGNVVKFGTSIGGTIINAPAPKSPAMFDRTDLPTLHFDLDGLRVNSIFKAENTPEFDLVTIGDHQVTISMPKDGLLMIDGIYYENGSTVNLTNGTHKLVIVDKPEDLTVLNVSPNPFNSKLSISINLIEESNIELIAYDASGRMIDRILGSPFSAGRHTIDWDATNLPSGIYIIELHTENDVFTTRALLMK